MAQALARRGHVVSLVLPGVGRAQSRVRRVALAGLAGGVGLLRLRFGLGFGSLLARLLAVAAFELFGLAKEGRQRPFTHARPLSVCHAREPPAPAAGMTAPRPHRART